jgi:PKD repeat protein
MKLTRFGLIIFISLLFLQGCEKDEKEKNHSPVANLYANVTSGDRPLTVEFNANLSTDEDEDVLTYYWDFGDGSNSTSINPSKTFGTTGSFTVKLTVSDEEGLTDIATTTITVNEPPDIFPFYENSQWVYRVKQTDTENGEVSDYDEGITYMIVTGIDPDYKNIDVFDIRITGKQYYNRSSLGDFLHLIHSAGSSLQVYYNSAYSYIIDLSKTSWSDYGMFFSSGLDTDVGLSTSSITIGLGSFQAYRVKAHIDNWGESYVTTRLDITEEEYINPQIGLLYRDKSSYVDMLDCSYCPVYGGSQEIELIGYYIPRESGGALQGGTGYNPNNPYGGNLGLITFWNSVDIGYTDIYLDGEYVGMIQNYWSSGLSCDQSGALNVFHPAGSYLLTADSPKGIHWEGQVYFTEGTCNTIELTVGKKSAGNGYQIEASQP